MIHRMRGRAPRSFVSASSHHRGGAAITVTAITTSLSSGTIVGRPTRLLSSSSSSSSSSDSGSGEGNGPDYAAFWKFLTVEQLKLACERNFLPTSGRKSVLVDRLVKDKISPKQFLKWYPLWKRTESDIGGNGLNLRSDDNDFGFLLSSELISHMKRKESTQAPSTPVRFKANAFDFEKMGIGGLDDVALQMFRRAFASRVLPHKVVAELGVNHVRGVLLYGPPGCGKTLIARKLCKELVGVAPVIVNGPEIKSMYHGESERKIRDLFEPAEDEPDRLRVIILDELDAICGKRVEGDVNARSHDSEVNQLLSMMDGVKTRDNVLVIGLTNRKEAIDPAMLRPGRLELHVEIGLPDQRGRLQIFNIHTAKMRDAKRVTPKVIDELPSLAERCYNFTGAEIASVVRVATSHAIMRGVDPENVGKASKAKNVVVQYEDFVQAVNEIEPQFGKKIAQLQGCFEKGITSYSDTFDYSVDQLQNLVSDTDGQAGKSTILLHGDHGSGKTAIAAKLAAESGCPFVRMLSPAEMIGFGDSEKCKLIHQAFTEAYKSPRSIILLDDLERTIEYAPNGTFNNQILQTLLILLEKTLPGDCRHLSVVATTSSPQVLDMLGLGRAFNVSYNIPLLKYRSDIVDFLRCSTKVSEKVAFELSGHVTEPIGVKHLLALTEMAQQKSDGILDVQSFAEHYERFRRYQNGRGHRSFQIC